MFNASAYLKSGDTVKCEGRRYEAVLNISQILSKVPVCQGCAFYDDGTTGCNWPPSVVRGFNCGGTTAPPQHQILLRFVT